MQVAFEVVCDALMLSVLRRMPHVHTLSHISQLPPALGLPGMGQREQTSLQKGNVQYLGANKKDSNDGE